MDWITRDQTRNDLAVVEYKRGDSERCLTSLSDTFAVRAEKDVNLSLQPADAEAMMLEVVCRLRPPSFDEAEGEAQ